MTSMDGRFFWTPLMLGERPLGLIYGKGKGHDLETSRLEVKLWQNFRYLINNMNCANF